MRMHLRAVTGRFAQAMREIEAGKQVVLAERGVPIALIEPLRRASKAEEQVIQQMIDSGLLQPLRKSGEVREWKWKTGRTKAA
jgi:antitoxin (DNA-binding transcriptional repressor) of toxin-antitoxin stability system